MTGKRDVIAIVPSTDLDRCALEVAQQGLRFILSDWGWIGVGLGLDWNNVEV